jgi:hypothetical protein
LKTEKLPESKGLFNVTAELHDDMAKEAAVEFYIRKMKEIINENTSFNSNELKENTNKINLFIIYSYNRLQILFYIFIQRQLLSDRLQLFKSYRKLGGKEYEEEYIKRVEKKIKKEYQHFVKLYNSEMNIRNLQNKMQEKVERAQKEREENRKKFSKTQRCEQLLKI